MYSNQIESLAAGLTIGEAVRPISSQEVMPACGAQLAQTIARMEKELSKLESGPCNADSERNMVSIRSAIGSLKNTHKELLGAEQARLTQAAVTTSEQALLRMEAEAGVPGSDPVDIRVAVLGLKATIVLARQM